MWGLRRSLEVESSSGPVMYQTVLWLKALGSSREGKVHMLVEIINSKRYVMGRW